MACAVLRNAPRGVLGENVGSLDAAVASHVRCLVACCRSTRRRATSATGERSGGAEVPAVLAEEDGGRWAGVRGCDGVGERAFIAKQMYAEIVQPYHVMSTRCFIISLHSTASESNDSTVVLDVGASSLASSSMSETLASAAGMDWLLDRRTETTSLSSMKYTLSQ